MNPEALLTLISNLAEQVYTLHAEVERLRAALREQQKVSETD